MRRTVIVLVLATLSLHLAAGVANAGTLKVDPKKRTETLPVTISGTTGCPRPNGVHVRSHIHSPGSTRRAIKGRVLDIRSNGSFSGEFTVRKTAVGINDHVYTLVSHCGSAEGDKSGETTLHVLPYTGLPVLPQLLVGVGLVASGAAMVRGGRRPGRSSNT